MKVEQVPVDKLIPYGNNARTHTDAQIDQIAKSIETFGWTNPILIDGDKGVIAGHGRLYAARKLNMTKVPCIQLDGMTETQKRAYIIADNKLVLNGGYDNEILALELADLDELGFDLSLTGFAQDEIDALIASPGTVGLTDEDAVPDAPEIPITVLGDVWTCGKHRIMCGDSTSITDVERLMNGTKAALMHEDPPYGMGKEADGVANDNLYEGKLDQFQMEWWNTVRLFLDDNAGAYLWGNAPDLWRLWYVGGLAQSERMTMRNEIVWRKNAAQGISSEGFRSYPPAGERCLFFMLGEQGFSNNADNYWDGFEPIRAYLDAERSKMGWTNKVVADFFGFHPRMADHWFSTSQWSFPRKEQYETLQAVAQNDAFKRDYDDLKRDFYATRAYFDNIHDAMTDVWDFPSVRASERHGHATPKPVGMMERIMMSSLPEGGLCVEPFGGSGSTLMGAEKSGRVCYTMELQEKYVDVMVKRWQDFSGKQAFHAETGAAFATI